MNKYAVILFSLFLCACGGGGSSNIDFRQTAFSQGTEQEITGFGEVSSRIIGLTQQVGGAPVFGEGGDQGSVMSSYTNSLANVESFDTSFSGEQFVLELNRQDGTSSIVDTETATYAVGTDLTPEQNLLSNRDAVQAHTLSTTDSAWTIMGTFIEWEDDDFTNYLAAGYWIHANTETSGIEFGAFVDSPEYNQAVTVPSSGRATYTGRSAGFYVATYGPGLPYPEGTTVAGEFQGVFTMLADFDTSMVSGQVRDVDFTYESVLFPGGQAQENRTLTRTGYMLDMPATSFDSAGQFFGDDITLSHPAITFVETGGSWAGRFSEVDDANGFPRAAAGVHRGFGISASGSTALFVGAHYGSTEQYE
ncbi:MAG: hypothetical protein OXK72_04060 [Gammaproteobacteria bacterium]|nr:hypothetical protein [Gammaproteobacteria bacterium]